MHRKGVIKRLKGILCIKCISVCPMNRIWCLTLTQDVSCGASGKELTCQCRRCKRHGLDLWVKKIPWRRAWQPTPVFLPGESLGQRSLVGYSSQGCKELDTTEAIEHTHTHLTQRLKLSGFTSSCMSLSEKQNKKNTDVIRLLENCAIIYIMYLT